MEPIPRKSDGSATGSVDSHDDQSRSPETGLLVRLRHWTDVAPVLCLLRVLRLAGSPIAVGGVWIMCILVAAMLESEITDPADIWRTGLFMSPLLTVVLMMLVRQGSLLTAGRDMEPWRVIAGRIGKRFVSVIAIVVTPLACVAMITLLAFPLAWLSTASDHWALQMPLALVNAVVLIVAGVLLAGSLTSIPLALAAVLNEPDPDPLDSLSRGYEYTLRGWLQLVGCVLFAILLTVVVSPATIAITAAAEQLLSIVTVTTSAESQYDWCRFMLRLLPIAWAIVILSGSIGGIYLMLRRVTGGQEIEDIWIPKPNETVSLPDLT